MSYSIPSHDVEIALSRKTALIIAAVALAISTLVAIDIVFDASTRGSLLHMTLEGAIFIASISAAFVLSRAYLLTRRANATLLEKLALSSADAEKWKQSARNMREGIVAAIDEQFSAWLLSQAEKEVGFLLLKGLTFKEIAIIRKTTERTSRQQAFELYRKAGLSGRADFSAFFLEDLFVPIHSKISEGKTRD